MLLKWSKAYVAVAACTLVGLAWRAEGLLRRSFWLDEVLTFWRARQPTIDSLLIDLESAPFPPLYYLGLWGWARVWGVSEFSVRALPMVLGVITVPVTYLVWSGHIGRKGAIWATVLLSTSAFHVFYSQDAKMYAAVWLLATLSSGAFLHALRAGPRQGAWLIVYGVSNAALLQVSYVGVVAIAIQLLYGLLARRRVQPFARKVALAAALSCLPCLAWLPTTVRTVTHRTGIAWIPPVSGRKMPAEFSQVLGYYVLGYRTVADPVDDLWGSFFARIHGPAEWLAGLAIMVYLVRLVLRREEVRADRASCRGERDVGFYLFLWAFVPAVAAFVFSMIIYPLWGPPRYLMASGPAVLLLLGSALGSFERRATAWILGVILISVNAALIVFEKSHVTSDPYRQMAAAAADFAGRSPVFQKDVSRAWDGFRMVYLEDGSLSDWNAVCVKYEIDEVNAAGGADLLRLDKLAPAVERGYSFFVIEIRPSGLSESAAREQLERRIASFRAEDTRAAVQYEVRPVCSSDVWADGALPGPLTHHTAQLWACLPTEARLPGGGAARDGSKRGGT